MSVPIHRDPVQYTSSDEVAFLNKLFAQDMPIIAAINRVNGCSERAKEKQWVYGAMWGGLAALLAFMGIWLWTR